MRSYFSVELPEQFLALFDSLSLIRLKNKCCGVWGQPLRHRGEHGKTLAWPFFSFLKRDASLAQWRSLPSPLEQGSTAHCRLDWEVTQATQRTTS